MAPSAYYNLDKFNFTAIKEEKKSFKKKIKKSNAFVCRENLATLSFQFADRIWHIKLHFRHFSVVFIVTITNVKPS